MKISKIMIAVLIVLIAIWQFWSDNSDKFFRKFWWSDYSGSLKTVWQFDNSDDILLYDNFGNFNNKKTGISNKNLESSHDNFDNSDQLQISFDEFWTITLDFSVDNLTILIH